MDPNSRLRHDEAVRRCALSFVAKGYDVRARVEGWFEPPDYINGYRPDIVAHCGNRFVIIEVKKGEIDWPKISALERFVDTHHTYEIRILAPEDVLKQGSVPDLHGHK
jgi:hypothetical protein